MNYAEYLKTHFGRKFVQLVALDVLNDVDNNLPCLLDLVENSTDSVVLWRSAWSLQFVAEERPRLLVPYFSKIEKLAIKDGVSDGYRRILLGIIKKIFPLQSEPINVLFLNFILENCANPQRTVGTRVQCVYLAKVYTHDYPELKQELQLIFSEMRNHEPNLPKSLVVALR